MRMDLCLERILSQGGKYKNFTNSFKLSVLKETASLSVRDAMIRGWKKNKYKLEGIGGMR